MFTDDRVYFLCIATHRECLKTSREISMFALISASPYNLRMTTSVDIAQYRPNIWRIYRPQNNNGICTPIFAVDPAIKHGCIAEQSRFIFRQRVCRCIGDVLPNFAEYVPTDRRMVVDYQHVSANIFIKRSKVTCSTACCSYGPQ